MQSIFYVYVHKRATDGKIFYVGKGCGERLIKIDNRNIHWRRTVSKHGFVAHKIKDNMNEACALSMERALIASIGLDNLVNMTNGGEGVSGYRFSPEQRKNIGAKVSAAFTQEHRDAVRAARLGKPPGNAGIPISDETRARISAAGKGKKKPEGFGAKVSARFKGRKRPEHEVRAMSERRKGVAIPEETRRKISEAMKGEKGYWYGKVRSEEHSRRISEAKKGKGGKPVVRSDGLEFWSAKGAAEFMRKAGYIKADATGVTACCKGRQKMAYGFGWKYANE